MKNFKNLKKLKKENQKIKNYKKEIILGIKDL